MLALIMYLFGGINKPFGSPPKNWEVDMVVAQQDQAERDKIALEAPLPDRPDDVRVLRFIEHASDISKEYPPHPDLRNLNDAVEALAAAFPRIQVAVFREMLESFSGESRLDIVANALLNEEVTWIKGRWKSDKAATESGEIPSSKLFRTWEYKSAARRLAEQEFKSLNQSTIKSVLAEKNWSYLDSRDTLATTAKQSWRAALSNAIENRIPWKRSEPEKTSLIIWRNNGVGEATPSIRATGSPELDRELFEALVAPILKKRNSKREAADHYMAKELNREEAEVFGAMYECCCCFTDVTFEEMTSCTASGHVVCFRCIHFTLKEAIYGQGWHSSIDPTNGHLKCMAVDGNGCNGHVPEHEVQRALMGEKGGADIIFKRDRRLTTQHLVQSNLPLIFCPFCDYAEVNDVYLPDGESRLRRRQDVPFNLFVLALVLVTIIFTAPSYISSAVVSASAVAVVAWHRRISQMWEDACQRRYRFNRTAKFQCLNPKCSKVSCLHCNKSWNDMHRCEEEGLVALRTQVEHAMSMAVKRTCPRCNTSFVKQSGCNKLTCPCGYKMCYICRTDITVHGYRHYCEHFRADGDGRPCSQCSKCNLWENEDLDKVLNIAKTKAERKWKVAKEKTEKEALKGPAAPHGYIHNNSSITAWDILILWQLPSKEDLFDFIVSMTYY